MKPQTAAKKLGIYLPATPEEFQANAVTHAELKELSEKLGITIAALKRNDMDQPLTTAEIKALLEDQPEWLRAARTALAEGREVQAEAEDTGEE